MYLGLLCLSFNVTGWLFTCEAQQKKHLNDSKILSYNKNEVVTQDNPETV